MARSEPDRSWWGWGLRSRAVTADERERLRDLLAGVGFTTEDHAPPAVADLEDLPGEVGRRVDVGAQRLAQHLHRLPVGHVLADLALGDVGDGRRHAGPFAAV